MTALTNSFAESDGKNNATNRRPSIKRKRLHLLYVVNDILYHSKFRANDASICGKIQPVLVGLFGSVASFKGSPKHHQKIVELLDLWEEKGYYSKDYIVKLREAVKIALDAGEHAEGGNSLGEKGLSTKVAKSAPYVMPAMHGEASTPWFDLPAGNLMPHIIPNSTRPINPDMIKPLHFVAGPADEGLVLAVKSLLDEVQTIFGMDADRDDKSSSDFNELGQQIVFDEITGDIIDGEGYYGWSRTFCEKMKRRKMGLDNPGQKDARGRRSRSTSSSPRARKRRPDDSDDGSSREDYGSTRRRRSISSSRSPSPAQGRNRHSGPLSRSRSYSKSPRPHLDGPLKADSYPVEARQFPTPYEGFPPNPHTASVPQVPFSQQNQFYNPNIPPPPPLHNAFYNNPATQPGLWPPPPPPLQNMHFSPSNPQSWPPPPPPPPPPGNPPIVYQQNTGNFPPAGPGGWQQGDGRGYNGNGCSNGGYMGGKGGYRGRGW